MRAQGRAAWRRFNEAVQAGRVPAREVLDGALVMFGGLLLLTPGFITDILGLLLLIPPTRALVRAVLAKRLMQRMVISMTGSAHARGLTTSSTAPRSTSRTTVSPRPGARADRRGRPNAPGARRGRGSPMRSPSASATRRPAVHGLARLGLSGAGGSALAVVFDGREPVTALARGDLHVDPGADFERLELDGLAATVDEPLQRWTLRIGDGRADLRGDRTAGRPRADRAARPRRRHGRLRAALPGARDRPRAARSAASASAGTRGASPTGSGSSRPARWPPGSTTAAASC